MKTKPLTFLLALTFLFLFCGSVYGGPPQRVSSEVVKVLKNEEKEDESVVIFCPGSEGGFEKYISVNMEEKTITTYNLRGNALDTVYKIIEENAVAVEGVGTSEWILGSQKILEEKKEGTLTREEMEIVLMEPNVVENTKKSITVHRSSHPDKKNLIEVWWGDFPKKALCLIMDKKF
jgi:hypothetical protein